MTGELAAILRIERSRCPEDFPLVCFRINRSGQPERVQSFRRAWRTACPKLGLGEFVKVTDPATGEVVFAAPRTDRQKHRPKPKMTYEGRLFHDLRRTGVRNLVRSGVPQNVAQSISGHRTASVFSRYNITSEQDVVDAARQLERFVQAQEQEIGGQNRDNLNISERANQLSQ